MDDNQPDAIPARRPGMDPAIVDKTPPSLGTVTGKTSTYIEIWDVPRSNNACLVVLRTTKGHVLGDWAAQPEQVKRLRDILNDWLKRNGHG